MGNGGKPGNGGAISPNQALELTRKINEAHSKAVDNEKRIIELEKVVNDKNQWNNTVRGWIHQGVYVCLVNGSAVTGTLLGLDRYTLTVKRTAGDGAQGEVIIHKGAIATIELHP